MLYKQKNMELDQLHKFRYSEKERKYGLLKNNKWRDDFVPYQKTQLTKEYKKLKQSDQRKNPVLTGALMTPIAISYIKKIDVGLENKMSDRFKEAFGGYGQFL